MNIADALRAIAKDVAALERRLKEQMSNALEAGVAFEKSTVPVDTGALRDSIHVEGTRIIAGGGDVDYASYVELGRRGTGRGRKINGRFTAGIGAHAPNSFGLRTKQFLQDYLKLTAEVMALGGPVSGRKKFRLRKKKQA